MRHFGFFFTLIIFLLSSCNQDDSNYTNILQPAEERQFRLTTIWNCPNDLKIYIPNCFEGTQYTEQLFNSAIEKYNAIPNTCLNIRTVESKADADIVLVCSDRNHGGAPAEDGIGQIELELQLDNTDPMDHCQNAIFSQCNWEFYFLHELGHSLGLAHDNWTNFEQIDGTPVNDQSSIMNSTDAVLSGNADFEICNLPCQLSEFDVVAIQKLYPACEPTLPGFEVTFNPCDNIIDIVASNEVEVDLFEWSFDFSGLVNEPTMSISGLNNHKVHLRMPYQPEETFCFGLTAMNECGGEAALPCMVCFETPPCVELGITVIGVASNACSRIENCPDGFVCVDNICCPTDEITTDPCDSPCESNLDCGIGYECIDNCCVAVGGNRCRDNGNCPPGFICIDGICVAP